MNKKYHQPNDKAYKFMYKLLGIKFHRYFFQEGENIEFIDTEIPESGKRRDMTVVIDNKYINNIEFQSNPTYDKKLLDMFEYHSALLCDKNNRDKPVSSRIININDPNKGIRSIFIPYNITFHPDIIFTKEIDGWEILNKLIYKMITQEELSDNEAIELLILPDTNIDMPINILMKFICFIMVRCNISDDIFKKDIVNCLIMVLRRFFTGNELLGMINMLRNEMENPEIRRVIEKYGQGFDVIYFDGQEDGMNKGIEKGMEKGIEKGKLQTAENLLKEGVDEDIVKKCTGISFKELEKIKKEF